MALFVLLLLSPSPTPCSFIKPSKATTTTQTDALLGACLFLLLLSRESFFFLTPRSLFWGLRLINGCFPPSPFQTWVISLSIHGREKRKRRNPAAFSGHNQIQRINTKELYPKRFQHILLAVSFREIRFFGSGPNSIWLGFRLLYNFPWLVPFPLLFPLRLLTPDCPPHLLPHNHTANAYPPKKTGIKE